MSSTILPVNRVTFHDIKSMRNGLIRRQCLELPEPEKEARRSEIGNFLLSELSCVGAREIRLLSLPSVGWKFERYLMARATIRCDFVACERNPYVAELATMHMPGMSRRNRSFDFSHGSIDFYASECARLFVADLETVLIARSKTKQDERVNREWVRAVKYRNCAWIDFCSPLCPEVARCLRCLSSVLDSRKRSIPVVISLLACRENGSLGVQIEDDQHRIELASTFLGAGIWRDFEMAWSRRYLNDAGQPMIDVAGHLVLKDRPSRGTMRWRQFKV